MKMFALGGQGVHMQTYGGKGRYQYKGLGRPSGLRGNPEAVKESKFESPDFGFFGTGQINPKEQVSRTYGKKEKGDLDRMLSVLKSSKVYAAVDLLADLCEIVKSHCNDLPEITEALIQSNIAKIFERKIRAVLKTPKNTWKVLHPIFTVTEMLTSKTREGDMFSANALQTNFVEETVNALTHKSVKQESCGKPESDRDSVCDETIVNALKTLINLTRGPLTPESKVKIKEAAELYCKSTENKILHAAEKLKISLTSADTWKQRELAVTITTRLDMDEVVAKAIYNTLYSWTSAEDFAQSMLTDMSSHGMVDVLSAIEALAILSTENIKFIAHLCQQNVVSVVNNILSSRETVQQYGINTNVAKVLDNLLAFLVNVCEWSGKWKYICIEGLVGNVWEILNTTTGAGEKENEHYDLCISIRVHSLKLLIQCTYNHCNGLTPSALEMKATWWNVLTVFLLIRQERTPLIPTFLLESGFIDSACREIGNTLDISSLDTKDGNFIYLCHVVAVLANLAAQSSKVADVLMKHNFDRHSKTILRSDMCKKDKRNPDETFITTNAILLMTSLALHGNGNSFLDREVLVLLQSITRSDDDIDMKHAALTFFVIMRQHINNSTLALSKFPNIITGRSVQESLDFLEGFTNWFHNGDKPLYALGIGIGDITPQGSGITNAVSCLANYLCEEDPLSFIRGDLKAMVTLSTIVMGTPDKFQLLAKITNIAIQNEKLAAEFLKPETQLISLTKHLISKEMIQTYQGNISYYNRFPHFVKSILIVILKLAEHKRTCTALVNEGILEHVMSLFEEGLFPFSKEEVLNGPTALICVWKLLSKIWQAFGCYWPPMCPVNAQTLSDVATKPHGRFQLCYAMMMSNDIDRNCIVEMQDVGALVKDICDQLHSNLLKLLQHDVSAQSEVNEMLSILRMCSSASTSFTAALFDNDIFKSITSIMCTAVDHYTKKVPDFTLWQCLHLIIKAAWKDDTRDSVKQPRYIDEISKLRLLSGDPVFRLLSLCILGYCDYHDILPIPGIDDLLQFIYQGVKNYTRYENPGVPGLWTLPVIYIDGLNVLAREDKHKVHIASSFRDNIWDMYVLNDIAPIGNTQFELSRAGHSTIKLCWRLALHKDNIEVLTNNAELMKALEHHSRDRTSEMYQAAYWSLLALTGRDPSGKKTKHENSDVAIVSMPPLEALSSTIQCSLKREGYVVTNITLTKSYRDVDPQEVVDEINASKVIVFMFDKQTRFYDMPRTVMNYARRIGKPYIGVFVEESDENSWEQLMLPPQDKVYLKGESSDDIYKVVTSVKRQIPKLTATITGTLPNAKSIDDFNQFALQNEIGKLFTADNFVGSVFDDKGGYLKIPSMGVVLFIPPGAIEEGKRQPVYCHVNDYKYGEINAGKVVLTPVVHCGPDDVTFQKEVVLSFPHSAVDEGSWNFNAITKPTSQKWNDLPDSTVIVKDGSVFLFLDHFTGFAAEASPKEGKNAQRRIIVGVSGQFKGERFCKINVGAWCDLDMPNEGNTKQMPGKDLWLERKPMVVGEEDTQLRIELKDIEEGWGLKQNMPIKLLPLVDLGSGINSEVANCQYILKYESSSPDDKPEDIVCCSLSLSLDASDRKDVMEFMVDKCDINTKARGSEDENSNPGKSNEEEFRDWNPDYDPRDMRISPTSWRKVCEILDIQRDGLLDWRGFAVALGLSSFQIQTLEDKPSPTDRLLAFFFCKVAKDKTRKEALQMLDTIFEKLEIGAARAVIREEMEENKTESSDGDATTANEVKPAEQTCHDEKENIGPVLSEITSSVINHNNNPVSTAE